MPKLVWRFLSSGERPYMSLQAIGWKVEARTFAWSPPTDVYETENSFVVRIEIAGMKESDFSICIEDKYLVVNGIRSETSERRGYHQMEIRFGEFSTAVEIPPRVNIEKAEAEYEDGFLTIVLPKSQTIQLSVKDKKE